MAIYVMLLCVTDYVMCYVTKCSKLTSKYVYTLILATNIIWFCSRISISSYDQVKPWLVLVFEGTGPG